MPQAVSFRPGASLAVAVTLALGAALVLPGCSALGYYWQAFNGQMEVQREHAAGGGSGVRSGAQPWHHHSGWALRLAPFSTCPVGVRSRACAAGSGPMRGSVSKKDKCITKTRQHTIANLADRKF